MHINNLKLKNFRNYDSLEIEFEKNFNIIYGDNAQGKTNIVESIFLCASGRSHRTSKDIDLLKFGHNEFYIKVNMSKSDIETSIEISYEKEHKKKIRINEIPVRKIGNLMGYLNAIIFSPEDLLIIKEGPSERRRFIDITISQLKPTYFYDLQQYSKVLAQRNTLLKEIQKNRNLVDTLEIWNSNLVVIGSRIMKVRKDFINRLNIIAENNHYKLTSGSEKLNIKYAPSVNIDDHKSIEEIETAFKRELEKAKKNELSKGSTLIGPQRDDYEMFLNNSSLKLYGSQGQQRTAVLSLKLSEIDIVKQDTNHHPVLLLDDVMSELDKKRQKYLFDNLSSVQTFITCTDKDFFNRKIGGQSKFFNVIKGSVAVK